MLSPYPSLWLPDHVFWNLKESAHYPCWVILGCEGIQLHVAVLSPFQDAAEGALPAFTRQHQVASILHSLPPRPVLLALLPFSFLTLYC